MRGSWVVVVLFWGCSEGSAPATAPAAPAASTAPAAPAAPAPAPAVADEASAAQILVAYAGATPGDPAVRRTKDEARVRAGELLARVRGGEAFDAVARAESDHRSKARGGLIGTFRRADLPAPMAEAIYALAVGEVSAAPVETPAGFHLFRRLPVEKIHVRHILVRYRGARNDRGATRTKAEAAERARALHDQAVAPGTDFAALARDNSEDASASQGGDLGEVGRGAMVPPFDEAAFALPPGAVSGVVESEFGFHVIQRLP